MHKMLKTSISRRSLLKLGTISGILLALPLWNSEAVAQTVTNAASKVTEAKPSGLVPFNAGWAIPLEDKSALLALEEKKTKEAQAAASAAGASNAPGGDVPVKSVNKSWADKAQDAWNKVKNFF